MFSYSWNFGDHKYINWNFSNYKLSPNFINLSSALKRPSRPLAILTYFPITLCLVKQLKHMPYHFPSKRISLKVKKLVSKLLLLSKYSKLFTLDNCFINHVFIGSFAFALISFRNGRTHRNLCISQLDYLDPDFYGGSVLTKTSFIVTRNSPLRVIWS